MKKHNIIWFVVDGVRTYRSGIDDRDRIDIMDKLAEESIEFTNAFTSVPVLSWLPLLCLQGYQQYI